MKIDSEMIARLAELARLNLNEKEAKAMLADLTKMLKFVEQLNSVNTDNVEPLTYINDTTNVLRDDETVQEISKEDALKNVPLKNSDFIKVPKVIKK